MSKFYFDDRFSLTDMVIEGIKTDSRRIEPSLKELRTDLSSFEEYEIGIYGETIQDTIVVRRYWHGAFVNSIHIKPKLKVGEQVAVAQNYQKAGIPASQVVRLDDEGQNMYSPVIASMHPGWRNKLFVREDLMPHVVEITQVRLQRLQWITDEDCLKEGVEKWLNCYIVSGIMENQCKNNVCFDTPREAFAALIDRISGKGTWNANPWVIAYSFKKID